MIDDGECLACGANMGNKVRHRQWHDRIEEEQARLARLLADLEGRTTSAVDQLHQELRRRG